MPWNLDRYLAFADERALPFRHLVAAVEHLGPLRVLDIGCGPGALTATLLERWPDARILGIDSSAEMIEHAERRAIADRLDFHLADVTDWRTDEPFDLVLSNAVLHWIEDHASLLDRLVSFLSPSGTLAFQVPANHDRPSHTILRELCARDEWRPLLEAAVRVNVEPAGWYLAALAGLGLDAIAWQTTYIHRLAGDDPVLEWVRGTTLRPVLDRLDGGQTEAFLTEYGARLREAYPARDGVTVFPFTRTFVVAARRVRADGAQST